MVYFLDHVILRELVLVPRSARVITPHHRDHDTEVPRKPTR